MWRYFLGLFLLLTVSVTGFSQKDTLTEKPIIKKRYTVYLDSAARANQLKKRDSLKRLGDSLAFLWIRKPNPNRPNQFIDSLIKLYKVENFDLNAWAKKFKKKTNKYQTGTLRYKAEGWVIAVILILITFFALIKFTFSKQLNIIINSFYNNRTLSQLNKEDTLFSSWSFIFLYLLLGLTMGMFVYLGRKFFHLNYLYEGFEGYLILSLIIIVLFTLKIAVLRVVGFLLGIQKLVREYVSILYLSYFNTALLFLPLVVAYSLTPHSYALIYGYLALILITIIFIFQFLRAGVNILSNFRFPKTYLFIYLCALELCPILILLRVLRL